MASISRVQLENWLKTIEVSGRVLDIGGSQNPVKGMTGVWADDTDYLIMDLLNPHEFKKKQDIIFDIQTCGDIPMEVSAAWETFDHIFCLEVAEYWYDPAMAMQNIANLLKPGGKAHISFHWLYGLHNPEGEDCLRYSYNAIEKLSEMVGLEIEDCQVKPLGEGGKNRLEAFYLNEKMRLRFSDPAMYDEGYLVTFSKK